MAANILEAKDPPSSPNNFPRRPIAQTAANNAAITLNKPRMIPTNKALCLIAKKNVITHAKNANTSPIPATTAAAVSFWNSRPFGTKNPAITDPITKAKNIETVRIKSLPLAKMTTRLVIPATNRAINAPLIPHNIKVSC